jgi:NAD(P)-dependent dehydrogenase (short-subunit alcohol dehydrogenase family)
VTTNAKASRLKIGRRFAGRRALITGGASGIGFATASRIIAEGGEVGVIDLDPEGLRRSRNDLKLQFAQRCDVRHPGEVEAAVDAAARALGGPIDVLVNAAGVYRIQPLIDLAPEEWDHVFAVNLRGTYLACRAVGRRMIATGNGGSIVNLSSIAALVADAHEPAAHYNASKAGVIALSMQLAVEWAPHGIRVNAVCPGLIDTPMLRVMDNPETGAAYVESSVPLRRLGRADEVASAIAFLLSDEAAYITGAAIPIDGGLTAC